MPFWDSIDYRSFVVEISQSEAGSQGFATWRLLRKRVSFFRGVLITSILSTLGPILGPQHNGHLHTVVSHSSGIFLGTLGSFEGITGFLVLSGMRWGVISMNFHISF